MTGAAQDVESPHVRIVAMHPVDRGGGTVILGELLNEDVVPAFVTVKATLVAKDGSAIATEDSFEKNHSHTTAKTGHAFPGRFSERETGASGQRSHRATSILVAASADPVIGVESQKLNPLPQPSLTGQLVNQSGQVVNITHVLGRSMTTEARSSGCRMSIPTAPCCRDAVRIFRFVSRGSR